MCNKKPFKGLEQSLVYTGWEVAVGRKGIEKTSKETIAEADVRSDSGVWIAVMACKMGSLKYVC